MPLAFKTYILKKCVTVEILKSYFTLSNCLNAFKVKKKVWTVIDARFTSSSIFQLFFLSFSPGKPFNPLLGETYELEHSDFRVICEQVCHHPPVSAFHADNTGGDFVFHGSVYPKVKFWGKSVEFKPQGVLSVELPKLGAAGYKKRKEIVSSMLRW